MMELNKIQSSGRWDATARILNDNFAKIKLAIESGEGGGGGFDASTMWSLLANSEIEQISKSHLTSALSGYATQTWVNNQKFLKSISWEAVNGKPSTFTPSAHTHPYAGSSSAGGAATSALRWSAARMLTLKGALTGSASIDGSADVSIETKLPMIALDDLDTQTTPAYMGSYLITNGSGNPSLSMIVSSDCMSHLVDQFVFGTAGAGNLVDHADTDVSILVRSYNKSAPNLSIAKGTWGKFYRMITVSNTTGDVTFDKKVTAASFVKEGGTASQFLKADGSVDGRTFLTSVSWTGITGKPSWIGTSKPAYNGTELLLGSTDTVCEANYKVKNGDTLSHALSQVDCKVDALDFRLSGLTWATLAGKPSTFTPSAHTHPYAGSSSAGGAATLSVQSKSPYYSTAIKWDCNVPEYSLYSDYGSSGRSITNAPSGWNYGQLFTIPYRGIYNNGLSAQFMWDVRHNTAESGWLWFRTRDSANGWRKWSQIAYVTSNVASASKWATARTLSLSGSVTGSATIDGSGNVSISTTTNHTHSGTAMLSGDNTFTGNNDFSGTASFIAGNTNFVANNSYGHFLHFGNTTSSVLYWRIYGNAVNGSFAIRRLNSSILTLLSNGNAEFYGSVTPNKGSDIRLKKNICYGTDYAQKLLDLGRVCDYEYNDLAFELEAPDVDHGRHTGLIYQKVKAVLPQMARTFNGNYGGLNYINTDYINIIAGATQLNTLGLRSVLKRTETLEDKVSRLEEKVRMLERKISENAC